MSLALKTFTSAIGNNRPSGAILSHFAQDAPPEPEDINQAYMLKDGKIEKIV